MSEFNIDDSEVNNDNGSENDIVDQLLNEVDNYQGPALKIAEQGEDLDDDFDDDGDQGDNAPGDNVTDDSADNNDDEPADFTEDQISRFSDAERAMYARMKHSEGKFKKARTELDSVRSSQQKLASEVHSMSNQAHINGLRANMPVEPVNPLANISDDEPLTKSEMALYNKYLDDKRDYDRQVNEINQQAEKAEADFRFQQETQKIGGILYNDWNDVLNYGQKYIVENDMANLATIKDPATLANALYNLCRNRLRSAAAGNKKPAVNQPVKNQPRNIANPVTVNNRPQLADAQADALIDALPDHVQQALMSDDVTDQQMNAFIDRYLSRAANMNNNPAPRATRGW